MTKKWQDIKNLKLSADKQLEIKKSVDIAVSKEVERQVKQKEKINKAIEEKNRIAKIQQDKEDACEKALIRLANALGVKPVGNLKDREGCLDLDWLRVDEHKTTDVEIYQVCVVQYQKRSNGSILPEFIFDNKYWDMDKFPSLVDAWISMSFGVAKGLLYQGQIKLTTEGWKFKINE